MEAGWIKLHRKLLDCWIWQEKPFDKGRAWVDLLLLAMHKDKKKMIENELMIIPRGSFMTSIIKLSERWGWSRNKVSRFLSVLESEQMLNTKRTPLGTLVTIVKYEDYQVGVATDEAPYETPNETPYEAPHGTQKKNVKNVNNIYYNGDDNINNIYIYARARARMLLKKYWGREPTEEDIERVRGAIIGKSNRCIKVKSNKDELLEYAFSRSSSANILNWDYVYGVINKLRQRGINNLQDAYEYELTAK